MKTFPSSEPDAMTLSLNGFLEQLSAVLWPRRLEVGSYQSVSNTGAV